MPPFAKTERAKSVVKIQSHLLTGKAKQTVTRKTIRVMDVKIKELYNITPTSFHMQEDR